MGQGLSYIRKSYQQLKRIGFISERMSYEDITLRGRWCDTVLNVQAPTGDKSDDKNGDESDDKKVIFMRG
jgi:hypothetical protein